jgi:hypothetical protein
MFCTLFIIWLNSYADGPNDPEGKAVPSVAARNVAQEIRSEVLMPPNGPQGRPLPLVSHWNMGSYGKGWTPDYQVELLDKGHHILPWMSCSI